jgi:two-component system, chemotaxis family, CheB/CheR fusion protein
LHEVYQLCFKAESEIYPKLLLCVAELAPGRGAKFPNQACTLWFTITTGNAIATCFAMTRVLLVEDCADVLYVLQVELEWLGYDVEAVSDADAALAAARRTPPDVIVSDLGLPDMDGFEFIKCIRKMPRLRSTPAIALTGSGMDKDVQQALALGFTVHLMKPVDVNELGARIKQLTTRCLQRKAS